MLLRELVESPIVEVFKNFMVEELLMNMMGLLMIGLDNLRGLFKP